MGLILPGGPDWGHYSSNVAAGTGMTSVGTNFTADANNTKGSVVSVMTLTHDCEYIRIGFSGTASSYNNTSTLADIMIDPAGGTSWATDPLIPDLLAGFAAPLSNDSSSNPTGPIFWYDFPLWIPSGAALGVRAQTAYTSNITTPRVVIQARGGNRNPASWWCGQKITSVGIDSANSRGQMHAPATASSWSSWASLGSPLPTDCGALQFAIQGEGDGSWSNCTHYARIGVGNAQVGPTYIKGFSNLAQAGFVPLGSIFARLAAGTQLQVSGMKSVSGGQSWDLAAWVVH